MSSPFEAGNPTADELMALVTELFPLCRSITGDGVRETLRVLERDLPLDVTEVPSGTNVLDWVVPPEWNIVDAYVKNDAEERVIDFRASNLHVVGYSVPVSRRMTLEELRPHLHTLPDQPDVVPYRTSYYERSWGFCLSQRTFDRLVDGEYDVCIDSTLVPGSLTYGEVVVPGTTDAEILISTHICHPSLCDDNLSAIAVSASIARGLLAGPSPRHTCRFLFAPGTIGAITWLQRNFDRVPKVSHGLTLTCLGDAHPFTYKRTVGGHDTIDLVVDHVLDESGLPHEVIDFFPYGYDERQFNSPGFRMPVGSLMRGRHGTFPEYHTSGDDLSFVSGERMAESYGIVSSVLGVLDRNRTFRNQFPFGEPQLGVRGLYASLRGSAIPGAEMAMLWVLNLSDGDHDLLAIAARSGLALDVVASTAEVLEAHGLLVAVTPSERRGVRRGRDG